MPSDPRPSPSVMKGVIPYLAYQGRAGEAAKFYAKAFGATPLGSMPMENSPGQFMHIQIEINGGAFMMIDCGDGVLDYPLASGHRGTCNWLPAMGEAGGTRRLPQAAPRSHLMCGSSGAMTGVCCAIRSG